MAIAEPGPVQSETSPFLSQVPADDICHRLGAGQGGGLPTMAQQFGDGNAVYPEACRQGGVLLGVDLRDSDLSGQAFG